MGRPKKVEDVTIEKTLFITAEESGDYGTLSPDATSKVINNLPPKMGDPRWSEYVINELLTKDERGENGHPKTEGLRRVAAIKLGAIIQSESHILVPPSFDNMLSVVASHTLKFRSIGLDGQFEERTFTAIAEASPQFLSPPFDRSPAAIASTKALGRALRDALQLKNVIVAEESSADIGDEDAANPVQVRGIQVQCNKLKIDPLKFINEGSSPANYLYKRVEDLDRVTAQALLGALNKFSQNKDSIPAEYRA